ncbi:methyltransferase-like protein 6 [Sitophilus oryzae]|uniref:tRNA N(3)-methylcytidine methyltransferase n=1 Tax=Sitophilus oryzae TaxID=7048 RepID=A0A6J2YAA9_SITOR|nr:methyltransferase-like protein 6 [Sitophilus oryzae]
MPSDDEEISTQWTKSLTPEEHQRLEQQNTRLVSNHKANTLENEAKKHWDLFYKRNETRFFKDRHWSTREFTELLSDDENEKRRVLFEIGCGVGNFIFPLIEEKLDFKVFACDLSPRAIEILKTNPLYNLSETTAFQCDITTEDVHKHVEKDCIDIVTLIFVLSAIHPDKFTITLKNIFTVLKPGGLVLFRDYGLYDMAQIRFKPGNKIAENFYMRQDGTRSFYFSTDFVKSIFEIVGFEIMENTYIHRRTVNKKENVDVPRIFVQTKARKPA